MNDAIKTLRLLTLTAGCKAAACLHTDSPSDDSQTKTPGVQGGEQWRLRESQLTEWIERREQSASAGATMLITWPGVKPPRVR